MSQYRHSFSVMHLLGGHNALCAAETSSCKNLAYLVPLIHQLLQRQFIFKVCFHGLPLHFDRAAVMGVGRTDVQHCFLLACEVGLASEGNRYRPE